MLLTVLSMFIVSNQSPYVFQQVSKRQSKSLTSCTQLKPSKESYPAKQIWSSHPPAPCLKTHIPTETSEICESTMLLRLPFREELTKGHNLQTGLATNWLVLTTTTWEVIVRLAMIVTLIPILNKQSGLWKDLCWNMQLHKLWNCLVSSANAQFLQKPQKWTHFLLLLWSLDSGLATLWLQLTIINLASLVSVLMMFWFYPHICVIKNSIHNDMMWTIFSPCPQEPCFQISLLCQQMATNHIIFCFLYLP